MVARPRFAASLTNNFETTELIMRSGGRREVFGYANRRAFSFGSIAGKKVSCNKRS